MEIIKFASEFDVQLQLSTVECIAVGKALKGWAKSLPNVEETERALVQSVGSALEACSLALAEKAKNA